MNKVIYTDNDLFCCNVLRARVADGGLPFGDVLEKNIEEVEADDLAGYEQIHLFAGIGGFGLACKLAGWEGSLLTGGFPCQDISIAGKGTGITGVRSGLWSHMARLIGDLRPKHVLVENVSALLHRGLERVLGDLAEIGYDAEWHCIPASAVGAPHRRDRIWILANTGYDESQRRQKDSEGSKGETCRQSASCGRNVANSLSLRQPQPQGGQQDQRGRIGDSGEDVADPNSRQQQRNQMPSGLGWFGSAKANSASSEIGAIWRTEPDVGRVAHGIPMRVDRLRGLGNAIVPQVAAQILRGLTP